MKNRKRLADIRLYRSMVWALLLVVVVFVVYSIFVGLKIRNNNHEYLKNDMQQSAEIIEGIMNEGYDNIRILSELVSGALDSPEVDITKYQKLIRNSVFDYIECVDKDGVNHSITGGTLNESDRKYYVNAMEGKSGMEIVYNSKSTHENLVEFYAPIYYKKEIVGSLVGVYQASNRITQMLTTHYFGERALTYLCTADGKLFASDRGVDARMDRSIEDVIPVSERKKLEIRKAITDGTEFSFYQDRSSGYVMPIYNGKWILIQLYPARVNIRMMNQMFGLAALLVLTILIILVFHQHIVYHSAMRQENTISNQLTLIGSVTDIYYSIYLIDMADLKIEEYFAGKRMKNLIKEGENAADMLDRMIRSRVVAEFVEECLSFADMNTIIDRLKEKKTIFMDLIDNNLGWIRLSFIVRERDENGVPAKVILTVQIIDEEKKRENELVYMANNDVLTGVLNRRAYEDDVMNYPEVPIEPDFVYASIDINGLKTVNDNYGHAAGDELIAAAADCLKQVIGNYGRIYRTGGDEFVAIFFADDKKLQKLMDELHFKASEWRGALSDELAFSVGYATKSEFATLSISEISKIADKRMYDDKDRYYISNGLSRRV